VRVAVAFEQAAIPVQNEKEFGELKGVFERLFAPDRVEKFLRALQKKSIRVRDFDRLIASGVIESLDSGLGKWGARTRYEALSLSDRAQIREFYLFKVEEVDSALRTRFHKLYQYY
jgi:hypothetical protein